GALDLGPKGRGTIRRDLDEVAEASAIEPRIAMQHLCAVGGHKLTLDDDVDADIGHDDADARHTQLILQGQEMAGAFGSRRGPGAVQPHKLAAIIATAPARRVMALPQRPSGREHRPAIARSARSSSARSYR